MNVLKTIFLSAFLALGALCGSSVVAQTKPQTVGANVYDAQAHKILKQAASKFQNSAVSFTVTMVNKNSDKKETMRQNANVLYNKGKYHITFGTQELVCNGTAVWHLNKDVNEVVVNKMSEQSDDLMNPAQLLSNYDKNFKPKFIRENPDGTLVIDLKPLKGKSYHKIRLIIDGKSYIVKAMEMHNYDSSRGEFHLSNYKFKVSCKDSDFEFDPASHKGMEIIDMR